MMHQSHIVEDAKGAPTLLVIGGKVGSLTSNCCYTDSVLGFDMTLVFEPWLAREGEAP